MKTIKPTKTMKFYTQNYKKIHGSFIQNFISWRLKKHVVDGTRMLIIFSKFGNESPKYMVGMIIELTFQFLMRIRNWEIISSPYYADI